MELKGGGWKGRLSDDGLLTELYNYFWSISTDEMLTSVLSIPDTVLFERGFPKAWYSWERHAAGSSRRPQLRKFLGKDISASCMTKAFSAEVCDIVATYTTCERRYDDGSPTLSIDYLTAPDLEAFLSRRAKGQYGVLQRFTLPRGCSYNRVYEIVWTPQGTVVTLRQNTCPLSEVRVPAKDRCCTFDGPAVLAETRPVEEYIRHKIVYSVDLLMKKLNQTEATPITGMVMYARMQQGDRVCMLHMTSLRSRVSMDSSHLRNPLGMFIHYDDRNSDDAVPEDPNVHAILLMDKRVIKVHSSACDPKELDAVACAVKPRDVEVRHFLPGTVLASVTGETPLFIGSFSSALSNTTPVRRPVATAGNVPVSLMVERYDVRASQARHVSKRTLSTAEHHKTSCVPSLIDEHADARKQLSTFLAEVSYAAVQYKALPRATWAEYLSDELLQRANRVNALLFEMPRELESIIDGQRMNRLLDFLGLEWQCVVDSKKLSHTVLHFKAPRCLFEKDVRDASIIAFPLPLNGPRLEVFSQPTVVDPPQPVFEQDTELDAVSNVELEEGPGRAIAAKGIRETSDGSLAESVSYAIPPVMNNDRQVDVPTISQHSLDSVRRGRNSCVPHPRNQTTNRWKMLSSFPVLHPVTSRNREPLSGDDRRQRSTLSPERLRLLFLSETRRGGMVAGLRGCQRLPHPPVERSNIATTAQPPIGKPPGKIRPGHFTGAEEVVMADPMVEYWTHR